MGAPSISTLTRDELYELVWSKPATAIASDYGISDVAVAKHCKKHEVPRPSRGYWAKKEAGKKPRKIPLPPTKAESFLKAAEKPTAKSFRLPSTGSSLHPIATALMAAIRSGRADSDQRVRVREATVPEVEISKALAERTASAFHVILEQTESLEIYFRKSQSSYSGGHFRRGQDRLYIKIEEILMEKPAPGRGRRHASWQWERERKIPSGRLEFSLSTESWMYRNAKKWSEDDKASLESILAQIVTEILRHFAEALKRRAKEAIEREKQRVESERRHQEYLRKEAIREQKESEEKHAKSLKSAQQRREEDLVKAAEWWRRHQMAEEFLAACERRWRDAQDQVITTEQEEWLRWAREIIDGLSPFQAGYPDPSKDGAFNPDEVPFGGPYPETRKFPHPPTMPKIPAPMVVQQGYGHSSHQPSPTPYPFWLKNQR
ncbi:MAG: hypothetical protein ACOYMS_08425 [Terrimicrobiaceae bacterium]